MLIRGCGRTDFQGGSAENLYHSAWKQILSLPENFKLYPAHDYNGNLKQIPTVLVILTGIITILFTISGRLVTTVLEEKALNPRLTKPKEEFIKIMDNLGLAYPKKIGKSIPLFLPRSKCFLGHLNSRY